MTRARKELVSLDATSYYHCICRCVRRAFLCDEDHVTGQSFEHRKQWVVDRLRELAQVFSIEVAAYAVMSNHYHVIVHVDSKRAQAWSEDEVIQRWRRLFKGPLWVDRAIRGENLDSAERLKVSDIIEAWRHRLADLSWFMRCLNEHIARRANEEDGCKGRFWEGRFKSQALLDEQALITCMAYVDLNPVRAGLAKTPEDSAYTSIQERIRPVPATDSFLRPFVGGESGSKPEGIPCSWRDYLQLVDWTGRAVREDKRGAIAADSPPILTRLGIDPNAFVRYMGRPDTGFATVIGCAHRVRQAALCLGRKFLKGTSSAQRLYPALQ